jgi:hypothetical protein
VTGTADLVRRLYAAFSRRGVECLLTLVTDDDWPDGPARMHGKDAARDDWVRYRLAALTPSLADVVLR